MSQGEGGEFRVGEDEPVGAHEAEQPGHELEGMEPVVGVRDDDSREGFDFAGLLVDDAEVRILECEGVETAHLGALVRTLLLALGDVPALLGHVVDELFGTDVVVPVGSLGIRLGRGKHHRGDIADFVLGESGAQSLASETEHNVFCHNFFLFYCY